MKAIELLAPAKNLECGIAAIDHGADAVYIGAPRFGARAAAGNTVADIAQLCNYAHQYGAKVYVTVNTIVYDDELDDVRQLLIDLQEAKVDAVLVQDMGLVELVEHGALSSEKGAPSLVLHASTQTDNRSIEKVRWLRDIGFRRVVLARELSLAEIKAIHTAVPDVELEVFVHGALCVSYSGACYASHYCFGRSANRGECAQFCRLKFDLIDANGRRVEQGRHLLSLKDLCQIDRLEELIEAGAVSLKIEGRLKDVSYVKNVTAAYSEQLNKIITKHPDRYCRSSQGHCKYTFTPNLQKTFNRGFTHYFLNGRQPDLFSPDTPKAIGEYVGRVKELRAGSFTVAGTAAFANGDGLCFLNTEHELEGFRVNRAEGNRLFPLKMPRGLRTGMALYRNHDMVFERLMSGRTAERKIDIEMTLSETSNGFRLQAGTASVEVTMEKQPAEKPQRDNIKRQLTKLGGTPYECSTVHFQPADFNWFIPASVLSDMRRRLMDGNKLMTEERDSYHDEGIKSNHTSQLFASKANKFERSANQSGKAERSILCSQFYITNRLSRQFFERYGLKDLPLTLELRQPQGGELLMQCRHCLKYSMGYCQKNGGRQMPWREPLMLMMSDGRRFRLEFDCKHCQMNVYAARYEG